MELSLQSAQSSVASGPQVGGGKMNIDLCELHPGPQHIRVLSKNIDSYTCSFVKRLFS